MTKDEKIKQMYNMLKKECADDRPRALYSGNNHRGSVSDSVICNDQAKIDDIHELIEKNTK